MNTGSQASDDFWEVLSTQRAIRHFKPDPVPRELLQRVIEGATRAPSGSNRQPWAFVVVDDEPTCTAIADALRQHLQQNEQMRGYFERGSQSEDRSERLMLSGALRLAENIARAPALVVPCLYPAGSLELQAGSSIYPAVQNMLLSARSLGLGTVLTTFSQRIEPTLRQILELPDDAAPVALVPIGYPDANFGPVNRRPVEEVLHWGAWDQEKAPRS
ncbi:MAG: nitroreductase family protein [Dehalococcoidia bacterium]|nr:nitroreductase family protein [Dehalococcoidia bacterium]